MGYFHADEQYLAAEPKPAVAAPWKVEARETGEPGAVAITWRPPYTPVDSYGIHARPAADTAPGAWQELSRVPAPATAARVHLPPGAWLLAVSARRAAADSPRIPAQRAGPAPAAQPIHVAAAIAPTPEEAAPETQHATRNLALERSEGTQHSVLSPQSSAAGWCVCCVPPRPLVRRGDDLVCPAHPERRYGRPLPFGDGRNDRARRERAPPPGPLPEPLPELDWTAIDTALRANSAQLGRHGLFVRPAADDYDDRYR